MQIMDQKRESIINTDNLYEIEISKVYGEDKEINIVKKCIIVGKSFSSVLQLGFYEKEDRAQEILNDIYAKLSESKTVYKMPKE